MTWLDCLRVIQSQGRVGLVQITENFRPKQTLQEHTTQSYKRPACAHLEEENVGALHAGVHNLRWAEVICLAASHDLCAAQDAVLHKTRDFYQQIWRLLRPPMLQSMTVSKYIFCPE